MFFPSVSVAILFCCCHTSLGTYIYIYIYIYILFFDRKKIEKFNFLLSSRCLYPHRSYPNKVFLQQLRRMKPQASIPIDKRQREKMKCVEMSCSKPFQLMQIPLLSSPPIALSTRRLPLVFTSRILVTNSLLFSTRYKIDIYCSHVRLKDRSDTYSLPFPFPFLLMQRRGKHSREEAAETAAQRLRTSSAQRSANDVAEEEDAWVDESASEDGALVEDGLGPLDDEEFVEDSDEELEEEEVDPEYTAFQEESSHALAQNMKKVTFDEAALEEQDDGDAATIWRSDLPGDEEGENGPLEYSNKAYDSFFQLRTEFPFLSFDIVKDTDGSNRTKYPLSMLLVCGSQADEAAKNHLALLRIHNVCRTKHDVESDDDSEDSFIGGDQEEPSDEEQQDEAEEINDGEPMVEHRLIRHHGSANRVRVSPFATFGASQYVAVWSDAGHVQVFDMDYDCRALVDAANWSKEEALKWREKGNKQENSALRFCTPSSTHKTEGYGLAWSALRPNVFASGDCNGAMFVWQPSDDGRWKHVASSTWPGHGEEAMSIEEITWSPTQPDVLVAARAGGVVEVWDTRDMRTAKRSWQADPTDVNVADWNKTKQASHLLVTGADSGAVAVWDLRKLGSATAGAIAGPAPIQNLVWHQKRITSVEFSVHNESVLSVTSDDGQCTLWDLSLERDPSEELEMVGELFGRADLTGIPDQIMFQHQGLISPKEAHWHSQIPGMVVTTDYNGLHLFKPMNWRSLMK
eukprot:gene11922-8203_t